MSIQHQIQKELDFLLGDFGSQTTLFLLKNLSGKMDRKNRSKAGREQIREFVVKRTLVEYDIKAEQLNFARATDYRFARMTIFHLIARYAGTSQAVIGSHFGEVPKHNVRYNINRCRDFLEVYPPSHPFVRFYRNIEADLVSFITSNSFNPTPND